MPVDPISCFFLFLMPQGAPKRPATKLQFSAWLKVGRGSTYIKVSALRGGKTLKARQMLSEQILNFIYQGTFDV
jgi:hypothetical protein